MDCLHGCFDERVKFLDASAHLENVYEAVVQHVVDVFGQTLDGRAAHFFHAQPTRWIT